MKSMQRPVRRSMSRKQSQAGTMPRGVWAQLGLLLALMAVGLPAEAQTPAVNSLAVDGLPAVRARVATGAITIDGRLSEPAWQQAEVMTLTQQSPHPGEPTPYATEVRVLIVGDALVFGFTCHDPNPAKIETHTLQRDGMQDGDDTVSILLDTFGDKRTGYYFQINTAAARVDGLVAGAMSVSNDWDGIWNARTARTADGWTAEIWIPAQTLNFAGRNGHWGLQLDRSIVRDQTELRWASPSLDASLFDMSRAGDLELTEPLKQGHGFELAPYLGGKKVRDFTRPASNWLGTGGGEFTWRITPQLAGILTVNTDFAETEVDSRQLNVTPFPLLFPEKRSFFLEGANQYVFGLDLDTTSTFIPFFSRNVGLLDGYNIPLDGGVKLNGHVGRWSLALLDVETRTTTVPQTVVDALGLPSARVSGTNMLASRVAYDLDKRLRLGTILTHGDPEALTSNTLAGVDAVWNTPNFMGKHSLAFGGWAATTQGDVPKGEREAWGLKAEYPNDLVDCSVDVNHFGDGFEPLLGYLPRPATHQTNVWCSYKPRPDPKGRFRAIRQSGHDLMFNRVTDTKGNVQTQEFLMNPLHLIFNSGDTFILYAYVRHETLTQPFPIVPTVSYDPGSYDFQRYGAQFTSSLQRPVQFSNLTYFGGFYQGHLFHTMNTLNFAALHGKAQAGVTADQYFGHAHNGRFVERLWQFKGALSWSPDLSVSTLVQYDNISQGLSSNTRLRWTFRPGDDFFVIWDRTWTRNIARPGLNLDPSAEGLTAKIRWTFRL